MVVHRRRHSRAARSCVPLWTFGDWQGPETGSGCRMPRPREDRFHDRLSRRQLSGYGPDAQLPGTRASDGGAAGCRVCRSTHRPQCRQTHGPIQSGIAVMAQGYAGRYSERWQENSSDPVAGDCSVYPVPAEKHERVGAQRRANATCRLGIPSPWSMKAPQAAGGPSRCRNRLV
jgi:hypothetical protein